jgi:hypothetical protein|tara:strand:+ start:645 stop:827 length:183 start_codon:yes stop_codon:yes gene_type:complete
MDTDAPNQSLTVGVKVAEEVRPCSWFHWELAPVAEVFRYTWTEPAAATPEWSSLYDPTTM